MPGETREVAGAILVDPLTGRIALDLDDDLVPSLQPFEMRSHEVIHGTLLDGKSATLLECLHTNSGRVRSLDRPSTESYACRFWIDGAWIAGDEGFSRIRFKLSDLVQWMKRRPFEVHTDLSDGKAVFSAKTIAPVEVNAATTRGEISFQAWPSVGTTFWTATFTTENAVAIQPIDPVNLAGVFQSFCRPLQDLLTIATGKAQDVQELKVLLSKDEPETGDDPEWIQVHFARWSDRYPGDDSGLPHLVLFTLADLAPTLANSLNNWFKLDEDVHEVRTLATGSVHRSGMFVDQRFLYAPHAVETYHRRRIGGRERSDSDHTALLNEIVSAAPPGHRAWLKEKLAFSNELSLLRRLEELRALSCETVQAVFSKVPDWEKWVRDTRNFNTHFTPKKNARVAKSGQILALTESLLLLLDDLLLMELGISEMARNSLVKQTRRFRTVADWFDNYPGMAS